MVKKKRTKTKKGVKVYTVVGVSSDWGSTGETNAGGKWAGI